MTEDVALFAVASGGSTPQWDGVPAVNGIMLRWLQRPGVGFPDYGYDLFRAAVGDPTPVDWRKEAGPMEGKTDYTLPGGVIVFHCAGGFRFATHSGRVCLDVAAGGPVMAAFPDPAGFVGVGTLRGGAGVTASITSGGVERGSAALGPEGSSVEWRTRGVELLRLDGEGPVSDLSYHLLHEPRDWAHLVHLCLPVRDLAYPCGPAAPGTDEDVARSRVPAGVDWGARYRPGFSDLHIRLRALATHQPALVPPTVSLADGGQHDPRLSLDAGQAVALATLDPHLARAVGLAWDDRIPLDEREWAYRLTGRWRGRRRRLGLGTVPSLAALEQAGLDVAPAASAQLADGTLRLNLAAGPVLRVRATHELVLVVGGAAFDWELTDADGTTAAGAAPAEALPREVTITAESTFTSVALRGSGRLRISAVTVYGPPVVREAIVPSVVARESGPPAGPAWIDATPGQPGGAAEPARAALRWDIPLAPTNALPDGGCVLFQPARVRISADPTAPEPAAPPFDAAHLLFRGAPVMVPTALVTASPPQPFIVDRPLGEGWYAWWVRGVDLFGRLSGSSAPDVERVLDEAPPPPPVLLVADYAQAALSAEQAALRGRTWLATAWLTEHPDRDAVVVAWAWTPELEALGPDVDGFRIHARRPAADGTWSGVGWGPEIATTGPHATRLDGLVTASADGLAAVAVTTVDAIDATHARCTTDLALDTGAGALAGARLRAGSSFYDVVGNGDGPTAVLVVQHAGTPPSPGMFELQPGSTTLVSLSTDIPVPPLSADPQHRRIAGVLVAGHDRVIVLGRRSSVVVARLPADPTTGAPLSARPAVGDAVRWYPAYAVGLADSGFGPSEGPSRPVAQAQVTVRAVRRSATRPVASGPATPGLLTAVEITPPAAPTVPEFMAGTFCAQLASAADWYGISRFTFRWNAVPGAAGYAVYRATGDALWRADREAHEAAGTTHAFPTSELPADPARRAAAQDDLAALATALQAGNDDAIAGAYEALRVDAQQLIAGQAAVRRAYVALTAAPLAASATEYEDRLNGRSGAHWFYRVAARSASGVEGAMSAPTPPICAPDVVPPQPPRAQLALAGTEQITLRWAPNTEPDLAGYELLRTAEPALAADMRDMAVVAHIAPSPVATLAAGQVLPARAGTVLEHLDAAPGGREWLYRLVALDASGNRSAPSEILRCRSLKAPPAPPNLDAPVRSQAGIRVSWSHSDARLACLVERRSAGSSGLWQAISPDDWLPRGVYTFDDTPPDLAAAWEYRVRVRDHAGQQAAIMPTVTAPAV